MMMMMMQVETVTTTLSFTIYSLTSLMTMLYNVPNNVTITYNLHTPENKGVPIPFTNATKITINDTKRELKVLCHGWYTYNGDSLDWYNYTIAEYMKSGNFNVITAHYENVLKPLRRTMQRPYSKPLGTGIGKMLLDLNRHKGIEFSKVHVIGHGFGTHVAGASGKLVFEETGKQLGRITGLDPANQGVIQYEDDNKLGPHDAAFVDTIYTTYFGNQRTLGKVDFHVSVRSSTCNYRNRQNGLAHVLFSKTINNETKLSGVKCFNTKYQYFHQKCPFNTTAEAGEHVDRNVFGKYYIDANKIVEELCAKRNSSF